MESNVIHAHELAPKEAWVEVFDSWERNGCRGSFEEHVDDVLRFDTNTGLPMVGGWVFGEGDAYFASESDAEAYCLATYGYSISELYTDEGAEVYYTEWV